MTFPFDLSLSLGAAGRRDAEGCEKIREDLARYRALIEGYHPDLIVETGTGSGAFALWLARTARCQVITIDTDPSRVSDETRKLGLVEDVLFMFGSSTEDRVVRAIGSMIDEATRPLVVLDSEHSADHVYAEMAAYGSRVPVGGWMVVEDTIARWQTHRQHPTGTLVGTPMDAVEWWMSQGSTWVVDEGVAGLSPITQHPSGWLRRIS
jgi:cephalosporin hydroxylase